MSAPASDLSAGPPLDQAVHEPLSPAGLLLWKCCSWTEEVEDESSRGSGAALDFQCQAPGGAVTPALLKT